MVAPGWQWWPKRPTWIGAFIGWRGVSLVIGGCTAVVAEATALAQLDVDLWGVSPTDFVPHCIGNAPPAVQARSAVVLVNHTDQVTAPYGVLVNLGADVPQGFEKFDRLIEVVSTDAADREQARNRWRLYTGQGYAIIPHDLNLKRAD